jgi:hypothetical protein
MIGRWRRSKGVGALPLKKGVPSNNGAVISASTWKDRNRNCLNQVNNTPDGKFYNFFSPLSMIPGMGTDYKESIAEDVGGSSAKFAGLQILSECKPNHGSYSVRVNEWRGS